MAIDAEHALWHAYGCEGWPSLFLWSTGGALSWFHFGEGEYLDTEEAIQEELRELDALRSLPEPMEALRPSDTPSARVMPPTPEVFPGGSWEQPWVAGGDERSWKSTTPPRCLRDLGGEASSGRDRRWRAPLDQGREARPPRLAEHERHEAHHLT